MRHRRLPLSSEEEEEMRILVDAGTLNPIAEHYAVTYREAYFIHKGKIMPAYAADDASLSRYM